MFISQNFSCILDLGHVLFYHKLFQQCLKLVNFLFYFLQASSSYHEQIQFVIRWKTSLTAASRLTFCNSIGLVGGLVGGVGDTLGGVTKTVGNVAHKYRFFIVKITDGIDRRWKVSAKVSETLQAT